MRRSTAFASCARRSRTSTSTRSARKHEPRRHDRGVRAAGEPPPACLRRRRAPDDRLPLPLLARRRQGLRGARRDLPADRRRAGRVRGRDAPRHGDVRDALPRHRARRLPHARRGSRRRRARAPAAARRAAPGSYDVPARPVRRRCGRLRGVRRARLCGRGADHGRGRWLDARSRRHTRPRARRGGDAARRALAPRLRLPVRDRERDRDLHALRRRARRRPARADRRGDRLGDAPDRRRADFVGAAVRGALPGRVCSA